MASVVNKITIVYKILSSVNVLIQIHFQKNKASGTKRRAWEKKLTVLLKAVLHKEYFELPFMRIEIDKS
jgi:uncharacterized membrane protein YsdA (DUF1294 family)